MKSELDEFLVTVVVLLEERLIYLTLFMLNVDNLIGHTCVPII